MYKLIAWVLSRPKVFKYLLARAKKTPYTHIYGATDKELYMERYWLFNPFLVSGAKPKHSWCPLSVRIHRIVKPDDDRHLHDHPWNARTFILKGCYTEERLDGPHIRWEGDTARLNFGEYHRISHVPRDGVYTLFVSGKYRGTWGFLVDGAKVPYRRYLGLGK
jgi:hypothetical protein